MVFYFDSGQGNLPFFFGINPGSWHLEPGAGNKPTTGVNLVDQVWTRVMTRAQLHRRDPGWITDYQPTINLLLSAYYHPANR